MKKALFRIQYLIIYLLMFLPFGFLKAAGTPGVPIKTEVNLTNPLGNINSFEALINAILDVAITIGTPLAVLAIIYCGFLFVKAQGKAEELVTARKALLWTIIGVVVLLGAKLLSTIIKETITNLGAGI